MTAIPTLFGVLPHQMANSWTAKPSQDQMLQKWCLQKEAMTPLMLVVAMTRLMVELALMRSKPVMVMIWSTAVRATTS